MRLLEELKRGKYNKSNIIIEHISFYLGIALVHRTKVANPNV